MLNDGTHAKILWKGQMVSGIVLRNNRTEWLLLKSEENSVEELKVLVVVINHIVEFQSLLRDTMRIDGIANSIRTDVHAPSSQRE